MDVYIEPKYYSSVLCDTDSFYFSLATKTLIEAVKPNMLSAYKKERYGHCGDPCFDGLMVRECCTTCTQYDISRPGCYKAEYEGDCLVALSSKCYIATDTRSDQYKLSLKGVNKKSSQMKMILLKHLCMYLKLVKAK